MVDRQIIKNKHVHCCTHTHTHKGIIFNKHQRQSGKKIKILIQTFARHEFIEVQQ